MMKKIYIAGPMTGYENYNRDSFNSAAKCCNDNNAVPLNPATLPDGLTQGQYMDICFAMIRAADAIYLLKGYEESKGAMAELAYAEKLELEIIEQ
jgi:nucleoside 2-deoxyribosyltransferase